MGGLSFSRGESLAGSEIRRLEALRESLPQTFNFIPVETAAHFPSINY